MTRWRVISSTSKFLGCEGVEQARGGDVISLSFPGHVTWEKYAEGRPLRFRLNELEEIK